MTVTMEVKKRVSGRDEEERERSQKLKVEEGPTEEEVDEFFAILRRMKLAINYFHRKGNHWRDALEGAVVISHAFDLNTVAPEAVAGE